MKINELWLKLKQNKKACMLLGGLLAAVALILVILLIRHLVITDKQKAVAHAIAKEQKAQEKHLLEQGFVPLVDTVTSCGYTRGQDTDHGYTFYKRHANMEIHLSFDLEKETCEKNQYHFDLTDQLTELHDVWYIQTDVLDAITNQSSADVSYSDHPWTDARLVAHAGGGYRDGNGGYISNYTNSLESLVQNYDLGCRVFEFDFALTTDGQLASVHDWKNHGNMDGNAVSSDEWSEMDAVAYPQTPGTYTNVFIENIFDEMLVNEDMYMVSDVKFEDLSEEEIRMLFEKMYVAAKNRDISLLNRVIPQVYSPEMYDWIMEIYPFPSVIFTCYKTDATAPEIIEFCASKDNVHVITTQYEEYTIEDKIAVSEDASYTINESKYRFTSEDIDSLHAKGLLIYNYTVSSFTKMYDCMSRGVDGIYSNNLLPQDLNVFDAAK